MRISAPTTALPNSVISTQGSGGNAGSTAPQIMTTAPQLPPPTPIITGNTSALYTLDIHLKCSLPGSVSALSTQWFYNKVKQNVFFFFFFFFFVFFFLNIKGGRVGIWAPVHWGLGEIDVLLVPPGKASKLLTDHLIIILVNRSSLSLPRKNG